MHYRITGTKKRAVLPTHEYKCPDCSNLFEKYGDMKDNLLKEDYM
jgi:predicted nucleic acid-binding Zn ribbon protein